VFYREQSDGDSSLPHVVVLVGSQGGYRAATEILTALPADFPAAIVLLIHRAPGGDDPLPRLVAARTAFAARTSAEGDVLTAGVVDVAPRARDLLILGDGTLGVRDALPGTRPASADRLLFSAAAAVGTGAIGVVLSGRLDDGAAGARALKRAGGRVLVQSPGSSEQTGMPAATLATGCADFALPPRTIAAALMSLVMVPGAGSLFRVRLHPGAMASG
jgi:two-component system chemotaxis response regulator CheB